MTQIKRPTLDTIKIITAEKDAEFDAGKIMVKEYVEWLGVDLSFQNFDHEFASFNTVFNEPEGALLLAKVGDAYAGVLGIKKFDDTCCELKRMWIRPDYRNKGVARMLLKESLDVATVLGYKLIRLDTSTTLMASAIRMYLEAGFYEIAPYRYNPYPDVKFYEYQIV